MSVEKRMEELRQLQAESPEQLKLRAINEVQMPSTWKVSAETRGMIAHSLEIYNTKHGLYAAIPLMCKGDECPYASVCPLLEQGMDPTGTRCPLEIGLILKQYEVYKSEFGLDEDNIVDMGLVKDLVDYDVQLFRADNKIAMQGDFIEEVTVTVTENGDEIKAPQISKAAEYKEKIQNKKHKVLQLMHSTRSDKAGDKLTLTLDPSSYAAQLMSQVAKDMTPGQIFDADYDEVEE
ncbi:hypothetical protein [Cytobacillus oceanisediminis]|uniref:hypothetical protein n=1 Tax=Cytobacillus oceanisediminis TaxID=665099 RepID=UPI001FB3478E|nr:hypothetical protein [Cytobacillus oceanisediminis]UOE58100.1 hypothetical protein IRB79_26685 [Cytobacillus oceanisediminis]